MGCIVFFELSITFTSVFAWNERTVHIMILSRLVDTFSTRILYLCSFHRTFTWYINIFRLFKDQRLIHTNPPLGVITFVFRMDLHHNICQRLILPRTVFINKILIKSLSADMQHPAIKSDFSFQSAVFKRRISLSCSLTC